MKIIQDLKEEVRNYLLLRDEINKEAVETGNDEIAYKTGNNDFVKAADFFYNYYEGMYIEVLLLETQLYEVPNDPNDEEFKDLYNLYYKVYLNFVDEILLMIDNASSQGYVLTIQDILPLLDYQDVVYALDDNLQNFETKPMVSGVTRAYIVQAIRKLTGNKEVIS